MSQLLRFFLLMSGFFSVISVAQASSPDNYLVSPAGSYHVGFLDYHWINHDACPSQFESVVNKNSFSQNNPHHCNELKVRVYYPTHEIGSSRYVPRSSLMQIVKQYYKTVSATEVRQINHLQSFSKAKAKIVKGKYPVIFFTSGYDVLPQMYENMLTTLVSYGYIVVAINSEFLNGSFKLYSKQLDCRRGASEADEEVYNKYMTEVDGACNDAENSSAKSIHNGKIVDSYLPKNKEQGKALFIINWQDLSFVYKQMFNKKLASFITNSIDFNHVGLLGHSLGAGTVAHFAEQQKVQAVVTLDLAWDNIYQDAVERDFDAPFLEIFSSQIYLKNKSGNFPYLSRNKPLRKDKYLYVLRNKLDPNQKDYALHMSFSDQATLISQPVINKAAQLANKSPEGRFSGLGNGWNIAAAVNEQLLLFFNRYLKESDA